MGSEIEKEKDELLEKVSRAIKGVNALASWCIILSCKDFLFHWGICLHKVLLKYATQETFLYLLKPWILDGNCSWLKRCPNCKSLVAYCLAVHALCLNNLPAATRQGLLVRLYWPLLWFDGSYLSNASLYQELRKLLEALSFGFPVHHVLLILTSLKNSFSSVDEEPLKWVHLFRGGRIFNSPWVQDSKRWMLQGLFYPYSWLKPGTVFS